MDPIYIPVDRDYNRYPQSSGINVTEKVLLGETIQATIINVIDERRRALMRRLGDDWVQLDESLHALHALSDPMTQSQIERICTYLFQMSMTLNLGGL